LTVYEPPKFTGSIIKQIDLFASKHENYTLPIMKNNPNEYIIHNPILPSFVTFESPLYYFHPD